MEWRFDPGVCLLCNFRRSVVRLWVQMACRANSPNGEHYPHKPNCPWRDATNRWAFSRHCVPVICPSGFTERCCWCTCCKKHGRWRPECLERLDIIRYFSPKGQLFSGCPCRRLERQHCEPRRGSGKEHKTGGKGAGPNFWKNDKAQGHNINQLKSDGSKMTSQIQLNLDPQSAS